jgi:UDP-GlcNAc:undecaprenyl-phosphate GlcNAc-1-phosphate transferase
VTTADKQHLHHRLMNLGHGQRRSVLILWAWTALLSGFVLLPTFTENGNENTANHFIPFGVAALGVALYTLFHPGIRNRTPAATPAGPPTLVVLEDPTPEEQMPAPAPFDWADRKQS